VIRSAQLLLLLAAAGLWASSRLPWVSVRSFDGLGQPRTVDIDGAAWSTALLPLAVLLLAAALAALAVRGWLLRAVAGLVAIGTVVIGYLGISLFVVPDVGPRGAALAGIPVVHLVGSERHLPGAALSLAASVCALLAAILLIRAAATARHAPEKYSASRRDPAAATTSERMMWDALDAGRDPTDTEGR